MEFPMHTEPTAAISRKNLLLRLVLITLLSGAGDLWVQTLQAQSGTTITLSSTTSPAAGQPGVTVVNLTGSNFPAGTIPPAQVTMALQVAPGNTGPALTAV